MAFGVFFGGGAYTWIMSSVSVPTGWTVVMGQVSDVVESTSSDGTTYAPIVSFTQDGQEYLARTNFYSSSKPALGTERKVAFDPQNPEKNKVVGSLASLWVVVLGGLVGAVLFILGPILFINSMRRQKAIEELMRTGHKVTGVISNVRKTGSENNRDYFVITVTAPGMDAGIREYHSDAVVNIGGLMTVDYQSKPVPVDVYISTSNPELYYVDIDDIPELTRESLESYIKIYNSKGRE